MRLERRQTESGGVCQMRNTNVIERPPTVFPPWCQIYSLVKFGHKIVVNLVNIERNPNPANT